MAALFFAAGLSGFSAAIWFWAAVFSAASLAFSDALSAFAFSFSAFFV